MKPKENKFTARPVEGAAVPALEAKVLLELDSRTEMLLAVSGRLMTGDQRMIALMRSNLEVSSQREQVLHCARDLGASCITFDVSFLAELTPRHLDFLERERGRNGKRDLPLCLKVTVEWLTTSAGVMAISKKTVPTASDQTSVISPAQQWDRDSPRLITEAHAGLLVHKTTTFDVMLTIPASDWLSDYAPKLGLGKYAVFEIPEPAVLTSKGAVEERVKEALDSARQANAALMAGDWDRVFEDLRGVWELLRVQDDISDLLKRDGYSDTARTEFSAAMQQLFDLSSKFVHKLDKDKKKILPEIKPQKEDAYLCYSLAMGALNLVACKFARLG